MVICLVSLILRGVQIVPTETVSQLIPVFHHSATENICLMVPSDFRKVVYLCPHNPLLLDS